MIIIYYVLLEKHNYFICVTELNLVTEEHYVDVGIESQV